MTPIHDNRLPRQNGLADMTPRKPGLAACEKGTAHEIAEVIEAWLADPDSDGPLSLMRAVDKRWPQIRFCVWLYGWSLAVVRTQAKRECGGLVQ